VVGCLKQKGHDLDGEETNVAELAGPDPVSSEGLWSEQAEDLNSCIKAVYYDLYPDRDFFFLAL
jgi:hypothetical protein